MRTDADGGQYGVCIFADGSECEEWAFFRDECQPGLMEGDNDADGETAVATPAPNSPTLTHKIWILQAYPQPLVPDSVITLEFTEAGELHGTAGCNSYFSSYMIEDDTLTIGAIGSTEMWCEEMMEQEMAFLELLQNASKFELTPSSLIIHAPGGDLTFGLAEQTSLEGIKWTLNSIAQGDVVDSTPIDKDIYIQFNDGQAQGNAGCNGFFGSYKIDGDTLTLSEMGTTLMACDEEHSQREAEFHAALGAVTGFHIEWEQLILTDEAGNGRLFFTATEPAE
jgi:heat shock protein HslJ